MQTPAAGKSDMKGLCLVLGAVCLAGHAVAADLPVKAVAEPVAVPYTWTGFYFGGNAGWNRGNGQTVTFSTDDPPGTLGPSAGPAAPTSFSTSGAVGGFHLGYNWQLVQRWLIGFEADYDFAPVKGHGTSSNLSSLGAIPFTSDTDQTLRWFGTIRGRLGFLPIDHLLIYGTGGFAYARIDQSASYTNTAPFSGLSSINGICMEASTCYAGTRGRTANGWTAGGGIEYALPNNWTIRAEYLYVKLDGPTNFDEIVIERQIGPAPPSTITANYSAYAFQVVRAGISYRF
jgi:outer membrane immunogenic protein